MWSHQHVSSGSQTSLTRCQDVVADTRALECSIKWVIGGARAQNETFLVLLEQIFRYSDPCGATHRSPRAVKLLTNVARDVAVDLRVLGVYCDSY